MKDFVEIAKTVLQQNLYVQQGEQILVVTDTKLKDLARIFYQAGIALGNETMLVEMDTRTKSGEEPPRTISEAMKSAEIVLCITQHSLTHTKARKECFGKWCPCCYYAWFNSRYVRGRRNFC